MVAACVPGPDMVTATLDLAKSVLAEITDPEIPVLTIEDIGILRSVEIGETGVVEVTITPTYSGCPALEVIADDIVRSLRSVGIDSTVEVSYSPAWTTAWMSESSKDKLRGYGIAPPTSMLNIVEEVLCPRCNTASAKVISEFGSTACKRLLVCTSCGEPFDQFKAI